MRNTILKSVLALVMAFMALPMMGQDFMNIYFKDGTFRIFHFNTIVEFFTSPYDSNGVQHMDNQFQHVKTEYDEFVYDVNDIDSIAFTKYKENVVNEKITAVMDGALPLLADCESIGEAEAMVEKLKNLDEVEDVWSNGHSVNIKIKNWETISFLFGHGLRKKTDSFAQSMNMVRSKVSSAMKQTKSNEKMPKIVIASQTYNNKDDEMQIYKDSFDSLIKDLNNFGYNSEDIFHPMPSLDFFYDNIYDYDIILLETHGDYDEKGHKLLTGYELGKVRKDKDADPGKEDKTSWEINYRKIFDNPQYKNANDHITWDFVPEKRIINGEKKDYWVAYAVVYESFFQKVAKKEFSNKNSVLFNGCCLSLYDNNKLADILREYRKLGTYLGYDAENTYGPISGTHFVRSVLNGISVEKAYDDLKKISISDINAEATLRVSGNCQQEHIEILDGKGNLINSFYSNLNLLPENQQGSTGRFVTPVRTVLISQEEANSQYNKNQTVTVEGSATNTSTNPDLLKCGFKLYLNETNYGQTPPWTIREIDDIKCDYVSSEINNFLGKLTGLERGKEYSYQAYIFDGKYYNYGETCKLKIEDYPELTLSTNYITLSALTCGSVEIASGSGSYSIEKIEPTGVVTASISENHISIEALTAGTAIITVKDDKSGLTVSFTVTVTGSTPIDIPAEAIDLGLPSGTLWANKNVGADKPEDGGLYFAWGEIVGYGSDVNDGRSFDWDSYKWDNYTKYCSASWVAELGMGIVDNKTILDSEDDAATVNWGENWRMPTYEEFKELLEYTTSVDTTLNGEDVRIYKSVKNNNSIFLPYTGYRFDNCYQEGWAYYWSSTQVADKPDLAYKLTVDAGHTQCGTDSRVRGFLVRPVFCGSGSQQPTYDNLQLSTYDPINMKVNEGVTFMILSGSGSYGVKSSDETVASVTLRDNYVDVLGESAGTATITVSDTKSGQKKTIEVIVTDNTPSPGTSAEAVDLGLPSGTKWADRNIGASSPEDYGGLYAWAMIEEIEVCGSYKWGYGEDGELTKYCTNSKYGTVDNKTVLDPEDDVACVTWGGQWRMPTLEQAKELVANCDSEWTSLNGVWGRKYTSKNNGNSIFIPAAGYYAYGTYYSKDSNGFYWLSTLDEKNPERAYDLFLASGSTGTSANYRYHGCSVRPVTK